MDSKRVLVRSRCIGRRRCGHRSGIAPFSLLLVAISLVFFACHAVAAPPADAELELRSWFEGLRQPGERQLPCCSIADCRLVPSRVAQGGYEVMIGASWIAVPADRVLQQVNNPTGRAVVCYRHVRDPERKGEIDRAAVTIFCFVRPPET